MFPIFSRNNCTKRLIYAIVGPFLSKQLHRRYKDGVYSPNEKGMPQLVKTSLKNQIQKALLFALAVHPALMVVLAAVFFRCHACGLLEYLDEVGLGGESQIVCDGQGRLI